MTTLSLTLTIINLMVLILLLRLKMATAFRERWRDYMADTPEAIATFHRRMPSVNRIAFTFWKPIKDSSWIPADMRAAKYTGDLDPDTREKLMEWVNQGKKPQS